MLDADTIIADSIGGTVPLLLGRVGFDPAVARNPLLAAGTDMCGFLLVLRSAIAMLSKLA